MARVTVEDCIDKVTDRFELILLASQRAKQISSGAPLTLDRDKDKNPVVALREIAESTISLEDLKEELIRVRQRVMHLEDDDSEDIIDYMDEDAQPSIESRSPVSEVHEDEDAEAGPDDDTGSQDDDPSLGDLAGA